MTAGDVGTVVEQPVQDFELVGLSRVAERRVRAIVRGINVGAEFQEFGEQGFGRAGCSGNVEGSHVASLHLVDIAFLVEQEFRDIQFRYSRAMPSGRSPFTSWAMSAPLATCLLAAFKSPAAAAACKESSAARVSVRHRARDVTFVNGKRDCGGAPRGG